MVEKFCSRSHGQPVFGVRRAAMMSSRREMSRAGFMRPRSYRGLRPSGNAAGEGALTASAPPQSGSVTGLVCRAACLEQEPGALLGIIDEGLEQARGADVIVLVGDLMRLAQCLGDRLVVVHELAQHVERRHEAL